VIKFLKSILIRSRSVRFFALARKGGTLGQLGWLQVNFNDLLISGNSPVPWFSYGAIDYINQTISPSSSVLELGGGGSTRYWIERGNSVTTVESDLAWSKKIRETLVDASNLKDVIFIEQISPKTLQVLGGQKFDVIVNDFNAGSGRSSVAKWMTEHLTENGIIIWDNSDREAYIEGLEELNSLGFGRISFFGLGPVNPYALETSILSKAIRSPSWEIPIRNIIKY
jgi:hypothetical protein